MSQKRSLLTTCAAVLALGCGSAKEGAGDASSWQELVGTDWELEAGTESYWCVRHTLVEDVMVGGFAPVSPAGTHHTTLSVGPPAEPDGITPCDGFTGSLNERGLWGSGVGTPAFEFPEGVGTLLRAGEQLLLNLHLYNTSNQPISGRSGMAVARRDPARVEYRSDATLMGPIAISLPPKQTTTISGGCTFKQQGTLFAVMPHMHRLGRHLKAVAERAGHPDVVVHDGPFDFEEQSNRGIPPLTFLAGDRLRVECTYSNDTEREVTFGESTTDEMCFLAVARYPGAGEPGCTQ